MKNKDLISLEHFCANHDIEFSFINSLQEFGLIELSHIENTAYISNEQIYHLEKIMRLHFEMDINLEGIQAILHLLKQLEDLHLEVSVLKNRLRVYE